METNRQDFIVGLVIVCAIAIVVGALIATSGWGEHRYDIYMRVASAEGITADTKVLVKGLEVGRVCRFRHKAVALIVEPRQCLGTAVPRRWRWSRGFGATGDDQQEERGNPHQATRTECRGHDRLDREGTSVIPPAG